MRILTTVHSFWHDYAGLLLFKFLVDLSNLVTEATDLNFALVLHLSVLMLDKLDLVLFLDCAGLLLPKPGESLPVFLDELVDLVEAVVQHLRLLLLETMKE